MAEMKIPNVAHKRDKVWGVFEFMRDHFNASKIEAVWNEDNGSWDFTITHD